MADDAAYTFVPVFRRGLADDLTIPDDPADPASGRPSLAVTVMLPWTDTAGAPGAPLEVRRDVDLAGPGDVAGLQPQAILRCHPPDGARDAPAGELAYVEFYDEDLPWRYTSAAPVTVRTENVDGPRLRPWLVLLVLEAGEGTLARRESGPAVLTVADDAPLPPPEQSWAWAHAQLGGAVHDPDHAGPAAEAAPDAALSRILAPRRLVASTAYTAYLIPALETGRLASLGRDPSAVPARQSSWGPGRERRFPVYHSWSFSTGTDSGFEDLVRRLHGEPVTAGFGSRPVRVDAVGIGLPAGTLAGEMRLEGALRPPHSDRPEYAAEYPGTTAAEALRARLDQGAELLTPDGAVDDPIVIPSAYGARHAGVVALSDIADDDPIGWVRELNLDPRNRAAAGIGVQIVRDRQEDLMVRAWAQVGRLRDANQRLREAELALAAAESAFTKHLVGTDPGRLLLLTAPAHDGLGAPADDATPTLLADDVPVRSVSDAVASSRVPAAIGDPAFRRVTRPARPLARPTGVAVEGLQNGLVARMDADPADPETAVSAAPPTPAPPGAVALSAVQSAAAAALQGLLDKASEPKRVFLRLLADVLAVAPRPGGGPPWRSDVQSALGRQIADWSTRNPQPPAADVLVLQELTAAINDVTVDDFDNFSVRLTGSVFADHFGARLAAKAYTYVTVVSDTPPTGGKVARGTDPADASKTVWELSALQQDIALRTAKVPPPAGALGAVDRVADAVLAGMTPNEAVYRRVATALPGLAAHLAAQAAIAGRRLSPVLAYPEFPDPMVEALRGVSQDLVLPNIGALPPDTLTVMEPNGRFIESFLAGLNTEFARELLWREFPTDQRGSHFRVFWDRRDALTPPADDDGTDVKALPEWTSALGANGPAAGTPLVLVLRSNLLHRFPNLVVTAHAAVWTGPPAQGRRTLDPAEAPLFPLFTATLEPDVGLFAFPLDEPAARGHVPTGPGDPRAAAPGYFFVFQERPGQPRFGLDVVPSDDFDTWDDLSWAHLVPADAPLPVHLDVTGAVPRPAETDGATWPATSADLASILLRSPVMYARHADDLLPREDES